MTTVLSMKTMIRCFLVSSERKEALGYEAWAQLKPSSSELACRVPRQVLCHVLCVTPVYPFSSASITGLSSLKRGSACFCLSFFFLFVDIVCCYFIALSTFYTYIQLQSYTKTIDSIVVNSSQLELELELGYNNVSSGFELKLSTVYLSSV